MALPNLRHLELLCEAARRGSLSAAARAAHLSQPAATQAIARLERDLGARLFDRRAGGVSPTAAGLICADRAGRALEQLRGGLSELPRVRARGVASLRAATATQLDALVAIVEARGFGGAARATGSARASLHRAARQLEGSLGVPLFEATSYGVRPTRDAERLARRAGLAAAELAQARAEVAALAGIGGGATVVGAMPLARSALVPGAILELAVRRPQHAVEILDGPYESMVEALLRGAADVLVGALRDSPPAGLVQEHLFDDPLALIVRADHPLAKPAARARAPTVRELAPFPWIAPRHGSPLRRHFDALQAAIGLPPPAAPVQCNSLVAARALLLASDRVMLLSARQIHHERAAGQLVALPHPSGRVVRPIGLAYRRDWRPTPVQSEFLDTLRRHARALDA